MEVHFNSYKIRYSILDTFFNHIYKTHSIKRVNVFIDLDDLFHMLHNPLINNEFQACGSTSGIQLISNVYNTLGHYRNWLLKKGIHVKIYGIYTSYMRKFKNGIYIPQYREKFKEYFNPNNTKYYHINAPMDASIKIMSTISDNIPDVYVIDSKYIEPSVLPLYISETHSNADWNIVVSRDQYMLQYSYQDRFSLYIPKGPYSQFIHSGNLWDYINTKEKLELSRDQIREYDHMLFILAKSMIGDSYRSIPKLRRLGWKTIFDYLSKLQENQTSNQLLIEDAFIKLLTDKKIDSESYNNNRSVTDIHMQLTSLMDIDKALIDQQIVDIPNYENLSIMNTQMFGKFPLNLLFLCNKVVKSSPFR